ncbi:hypothetical protein MUL_2830 [Mycobacterium ulcerans Agy99]|uniref:Uncharacterized protein n=1 Tax=Mycobacterium ulcerans (strain Agy99) TaxID=362242 RepID=A0PRZ7_MYCUA|nr:hypothetical protein MUL_2830 [Mycobacterium ulcerans Agy99]
MYNSHLKRGELAVGNCENIDVVAHFLSVIRRRSQT